MRESWGEAFARPFPHFILLNGLQEKIGTALFYL